MLSEKQATLLMPSSAKILLTVSTQSLCLVGILGLLICKADDFQIAKPPLLLGPGLHLPLPQWVVNNANTSTAFPPSKGILPPATCSEPIFYGILEFLVGLHSHSVQPLI